MTAPDHDRKGDEMARIDYPERAGLPPELRTLLEQLPKKRHPPIDMLAHSPALAEGFMRVAKAQFTEIELPPRRRELLILTVAHSSDCEYEYRQHVAASRAAGVEDEVREAIWDGSLEPATLADDDRALLAFVGAILASPRVSDAVLEAARAHLSDREVVEVLHLVGWYWALGRLCTVLDLEIEEAQDQSNINAVADLP
jgi:AhpD family alkylhydroperoxidase